VRALEHAATLGPVVQPGEAVASQKIDASSRLRVVGAILSGTHEAGTSHYDMLRAFVEEATLNRISRALDEHGYRTHEFGDSVFLEAATQRGGVSQAAIADIRATRRYAETPIRLGATAVVGRGLD
jgi:S-adenosylmethionine:tRNA ribosyltransferase-isomerase